MTTRDILDANPGLALRLRAEAERKDAFNARVVKKMVAIVKAAKSAGRIQATVTDADIADISAYLRDFAAQHVAGKFVDTMSKHPGMIHGC